MLVRSSTDEWIISEAIIKGYISYSEAYSPTSWLDDSDIDRLSELLNLTAIRDLAGIPDGDS